MEPVIVLGAKKKGARKTRAASVAAASALSVAGTKARKKPATRKPAAAKLKAKSTKKDGAPPRMRKPAKPDDLKRISGVGPKLEGVLNGLGIYKFDQIAKWKKAEREWVDTYLNFKGRIERDDWVSQAKKLAREK